MFNWLCLTWENGNHLRSAIVWVLVHRIDRWWTWQQHLLLIFQFTHQKKPSFFRGISDIWTWNIKHSLILLSEFQGRLNPSSDYWYLPRLFLRILFFRSHRISFILWVDQSKPDLVLIMLLRSFKILFLNLSWLSPRKYTLYLIL